MWKKSVEIRRVKGLIGAYSCDVMTLYLECLSHLFFAEHISFDPISQNSQKNRRSKQAKHAFHQIEENKRERERGGGVRGMNRGTKREMCRNEHLLNQNWKVMA